jgi:hypothetical protein
MDLRDAIFQVIGERLDLRPHGDCDDYDCTCQARFKGLAWRQVCQCDAPPADTGWKCSECGTDYERLE